MTRPTSGPGDRNYVRWTPETDLYLCRRSTAKANPIARRNPTREPSVRLLTNRGNGTFEDVKTAGLAIQHRKPRRRRSRV